MRWGWVALALVAAFVGGTRVAGGAPEEPAKPAEVVKELNRRQKLLFKDLRKIKQAAKDVLEVREIRESKRYVTMEEDEKMEKQGRKDLHIFMERSRNDTLEVLAIYDRLLKKEHYVEPLRRIFGKALDAVVAVDWDEQDIESIVDELSDAYGVKMYLGGGIDYRRTLSLEGEMSLISILFYLENVLDAKLVVRKGKPWFVRVSRKPKPSGEDD